MNLAKVEGGQILSTIGAYWDNQFLSEVEFFAQFFPSHFLNPHFWSGPSLLLLRGSDTQFQGFDEVSLKSRDFRKWGPTFMILGTTNWSKSTFPTHFNDLSTLFPHPNSKYQNDPQLLRCMGVSWPFTPCSIPLGIYWHEMKHLEKLPSAFWEYLIPLIPLLDKRRNVIAIPYEWEGCYTYNIHIRSYIALELPEVVKLRGCSPTKVTTIQWQMNYGPRNHLEATHYWK